MTAAILATARAILREDGVGALNLNEIARRIGLTAPAMYAYFSDKSAIYDALYQLALRMMREADTAVWESYEPGWDQLQAWFDARIAFAMEALELYNLAFNAPVPGFTPSEASVAEARLQLVNTVTGLKKLIDVSVIEPGIPTERAVDLLLAVRHGIIAERLGKASVVSPESGRFDDLVPDALSLFRAAWSE